MIWTLKPGAPFLVTGMTLNVVVPLSSEILYGFGSSARAWMFGSLRKFICTRVEYEETGSANWSRNGVVPATTLKYWSTRLTRRKVVTPAVSCVAPGTERPPDVGF